MKKKLKKISGQLDAVALSVGSLKHHNTASNLLIDQITIEPASSSHTREYRFYTAAGNYSGSVREIGDDYVRIRLSSDSQGAYEDMFINMSSVSAVKETFSRE